MIHYPAKVFTLVISIILLTTYNVHCQQPEFNVDDIQQYNYLAPEGGLLDVGQITIQRIDVNPNIFFLTILSRCPISGDTIPIQMNIPFPPLGDLAFPTTLTIPLDPCDDFPPLPPIQIEIVELSLVATPAPIQEVPPSAPIIFDNYFPIPTDFVVFGNPRDSLLEQAIPVILLQQPLPCVFNPVLPVIYKERGCEIPNFDLDNNSNPADADYAGDKNACVPTAFSNSMMWLRDQHPEIKAILDSVFNDPVTRHRDILEDMSAIFNRDTCDGVSFYTFAKGKQAFMDKYKLPIKVKFQNVFTNADVLSADSRYGNFADNQNTNGKCIDMSWVYQELCDGEDLEMDYDCYWVDDMGNVRPDDPATTADESYDYGHCVTITGLYEHDGLWGVRYKHDRDQDKPGGTQMDFTWLKEDPTPGIDGKLLLDNGSNRKLPIITPDGMGGMDTTVYTSRCFVGDIMSESFDNTVTYDSVPCPPNLTLVGDTLCSGVYIAMDTICLQDVHIKAGQEVLFKGDEGFVKGVFTQGANVSWRFVNSGCP